MASFANPVSNIASSFMPSSMRMNPWGKVASRDTLLAREKPLARMTPQNYNPTAMMRDQRLDRFKA